MIKKIEFQFSASQEKKILAWTSTLPPVFTGAIGGRFTYSLTPTERGNIVKIKDAVTKEELDVTEYEAW